MVKRGKELHNIKSNDTSMTLLKPASLNKVSEIDPGIGYRLLSDASKLVGIQEPISYHMELEPIADGLFNKFAHSVQ